MLLDKALVVNFLRILLFLSKSVAMLDKDMLCVAPILFIDLAFRSQAALEQPQKTLIYSTNDRLPNHIQCLILNALAD